MRPRLTLLSAAFVSGTAVLAQPVLNASNNVPVAGTDYAVSSGEAIPTGGTGPDLLYGFWMLVGDGNRNIYYMAPSVTPTSSQIPSAQLLSTDGGSDTLFWAVTTDGLTQVGERTDLALVNYTDPLLEIEYPCTFGTSWTDAVSASYSVSGFPVTRTGTVTGIADGYGTLELPAVVVEDVLRVKVRKVLLDQSPLANVSRVSETFYFFTETVRHPVLRIQIDSVTIGAGAPGVTSEALWMYGDGMLSVGSIEMADVQFTAYPNPANELVHLLLNEGADAARFVEVVDGSGRLVLRNDFIGRAEQDMQAAFNVSGLAPGLYMVRLSGEHGVLGTQRLVVR